MWTLLYNQKFKYFQNAKSSFAAAYYVDLIAK